VSAPEAAPNRGQTAVGNGLAYSDDGAGPAVVMLHGLAGFRQLWQEQVPYLTRAGFRVICVDLPGHGGSRDTKGPLTIDSMADAVASLLDNLDVAAAAIVGHSMGGRTMFTFAVDRPNRVWAIVPVGAQSEAPRDEYRRTLDDLRARTIEGGLPAFRKAFLDAGEIPERTERDASFAGWYWKYFEQNRASSLVKGLDAIFAMRTLTPDLGVIKAPALAVVGSEDAPFIPLARRYETLLPNCRTVVVEGCRHYPMTDAEPLFSKVLTEFLSANRPTS
jgi:pimeloyl-ACP methyl ester carboxylesterase